ncbi:ERAD-associated E3 ubiquitin-protein ligase component [Seminavis robusta]|uniref:ERAD-associated E3 ubiquitin-protein ligase component n=1 Tax=Seminavis robusta TaxID=568900 RepID=A0A9N8HN61_9STRA|nr:ERAD-associated E3 ubiquitin-protein ligase component [Seminavis robusta]|eukprot:Sro963_g225330.1 ERAD-associated E3 ubiquitin-protein ligase component (204) ;mRNA; f:24961-25572
MENHPRDLKSPMTNQRIGRKLLPAVQHRNTIEALVETGVIEEDLAAKWKAKMKEQKDMEELLNKAEEGDGVAMFNVGIKYAHGLHGFKEDGKLAFQWFKRAHEAGNVYGTACLGECYLEGCGVARSNRGMAFIGIAAGQGSDLASYYLGMAFATGKYGMHVDKANAIRWLEKAAHQGCPYKHLNDDCKIEAQQKLDQLRAHSL